MKSPRPFAATDNNVWTLSAELAGADRCSSRVGAARAPHLQRCIKAGLGSVVGAELVVTESGRAAIADLTAREAGAQ